MSLRHARLLIEEWRQDYNAQRPHTCRIIILFRSSHLFAPIKNDHQLFIFN
ncbi:MAG: integrase core domain-containing protein [Rhodocyclaceae bacterium]|nr:integrase core domain-containing protein [Rhodocyclaceae bacterium]